MDDFLELVVELLFSAAIMVILIVLVLASIELLGG